MSQQITIPGSGDTLAERYVILDELGRGSYGIVFHARDSTDGREVAIKTLLPQAFLDREATHRFEREAQVVSRMHHPNIIELFDYGQRDNLFYMVMEFIEGRSLDDLLREKTPLSEVQVLDLISQLLLALEHAHERGIVHRDLKPANILLRPVTHAMREEQVKVLDFGIAKATRGEHQDFKTLTQAGHVLGTPHYMSPEQISGDEIDHRADLYAAGIILYELLTGEHPFEGTSSTAVMVAHLRDDPPPLPNGLEHRKWGRAVREALRKQPEDRISSARAFLDILLGEDTQAFEHETGEITNVYRGEDLMALRASVELPAVTDMTSPGGSAADATREWSRYDDPTAPPSRTMSPSPSFGTTPVGFDAASRTSAPDAAPPQPQRSPVALGLVLFASALFIALALYVIVQETSPSQRAERSEDASAAREVAASTASREAIAVARSTAASAQTLGVTIETLATLDDGDPDGAGDPNAPHTTQGSGDDGLPDRKPVKTQPSASIALKIATTPPGATVKIDQEEVGSTPLTHKVKRSDKTVTVSVSLIGHKRKTRSLKLNKNHDVSFKLDAELLRFPP